MIELTDINLCAIYVKHVTIQSTNMYLVKCFYKYLAPYSITHSDKKY